MKFGYIYLAGCKINNGGLLIIDVFTNPGSPEFVSFGEDMSVRRIFVQNNIAYAAMSSGRKISFYDVTDKLNIVNLGNAPYENAITGIWKEKGSNTLFTSDFLSETSPLNAYNIVDFSNLVQLDQHSAQLSFDSRFVSHSVYALDGFVHTMYYSDSYVIIDGSRPHNLVEVANYNIHENFDKSSLLTWGFDSSLPSGHVIISDAKVGLIIVKPEYKRASWLEGQVTAKGTGEKLKGVTIEIENIKITESTDTEGNYATGHHQSGTFMVKATKFGYYTLENEVEFINGQVTNGGLELEPIPRSRMQGQVVEVDGQGIEGVRVILKSDSLTYEIISDSDGEFVIDGVLPDRYEIDVFSWGYIFPEIESLDITPSDNQVILSGVKGYEDDFKYDLGWEVSDGYTVSGAWQRIRPVDNFEREYFGPIDDTNDNGSLCYMLTKTDCNISCIPNSDSVLLTSPSFDVASYNRPFISFYQWNHYFPMDADRLEVELSNGEDKVVIDDLFYDVEEPLEWTKFEIDIAEHLTPASSMRISFVSETPSNSSVAKIGIDDFKISDSMPTSVDVADSDQLDFSVYPNPSYNTFAFSFNEDKNDVYDIAIYNIVGDLVLTERIVAANQTFGKNLIPGVYFANISNGKSTSQSIRLVKM